MQNHTSRESIASSSVQVAELREGCMDVVKWREQTVWRPGLSQQLNVILVNCRRCIQEKQIHKEPLIPSQHPEHICDKVCLCPGTQYLPSSCSYFLKYVESAQQVIIYLKYIFACHFILEVLVTDNGPQVFGHFISSFKASTGVKWAAQTIKNILKIKQRIHILLHLHTEPHAFITGIAELNFSWGIVSTSIGGPWTS